jgi:hypothetical protein
LASVIEGPHYVGILIELIGLHFGRTVAFMIGELRAFARRNTWDCLGTLRDAGILDATQWYIGIFNNTTFAL